MASFFRSLIVPLLLALLVGPASVAAETPAGALRLAAYEPRSMDPAVVDWHYGDPMMNQIYEGLVRVNDAQAIVPALAESWTVSPDAQVLTFSLAQAYFANGRRVVGSDFVYSLMRVLSRDVNGGYPSGNVEALYDIKGARAYSQGSVSTPVGIEELDPATVRITLETPMPSHLFLLKLASSAASVVAKEEVEAGGKEWWRDPARRAGTGPFMLESWEAGQSVRLVRNPLYDRSAVRLETLQYRFVAYPLDALALYRAGELDTVIINGGNVYDLSQDQTLQRDLERLPGTCYYYWSLDNSKAPFTGTSGRALRQAINHAVDKQAWINAALILQSGFPAQGVIPPSIYGHNAALEGLDYNLNLARQRLAESGYAGNPPIVIATTSARRPQAQLLADQLRAHLGIEATVTTSAPSEAQIGYNGWCADYSDPENFVPVLLKTGATYNRTRYSSPTFDALMDQAASTLNEPLRVTLYQQGEQMAVTDAAELPLYFDQFTALVRPTVFGPLAQRLQWNQPLTEISMADTFLYLPLIQRSGTR